MQLSKSGGPENAYEKKCWKKISSPVPDSVEIQLKQEAQKEFSEISLFI